MDQNTEFYEECAKLVARFKAGDTVAFELLFTKTERTVYAICYSALDNAEEARDLMQEVYLYVYQNIDSLKDDRAFVAWVKTIAYSKARDLKKKKSYHDTAFDDAVASDESLLLDDDLESLPDAYVMDRAKRDALYKIIKESLSDVQFQTIHMYYYGELSVEDIAKSMNCPEGTVKTRLMKSRAKIKEGVKKYEKDNKDAFAGAPAVPFLTRFFRAASEDFTVPPVDISSLVGGGASKAVTSMAAKETVKAGFLSSAAGKITMGTLALALVASAAVTTKIIVDRSKDEVFETTEEAIETEITEVDLVSYTETTEFTANVNVLNYNGHSYACYYGCATWEEASELCKTQGGYLAVINSQEENDVLFTFTRSLGYDNVYIGLSDSLNEGEWEWVTGDALDYTNWNLGEPNAFTDSEDYAVFADDGTWNDGEFTPRIENGLVCFICEWDYYVTGIVNLVPEDLAAPVEASYDFDRDNIVVDTVVNRTVDAWDYEFHLPQITLESDEAALVNNLIITDLMDHDSTWTEYAVVWANDEIFSIVIDYSYNGWAGFYRAYTFNASTGHWLANSEILEFAGLDEASFYTQATNVIGDHLNDSPMMNIEGVPVTVNGQVNPDWAAAVDALPTNYDWEDNHIYVDMANNALSVSPDMGMFLNQEGHVTIWRALWPIADYHDCEEFFDIETGERFEYRDISPS